jgi:glyoxylase-like metal-dependent hydrolase (beta-lactamase superfamily II)
VVEHTAAPDRHRWQSYLSSARINILMAAQRMYTLTFGVEYVPKSLSVPGGGSHTITTPIYGALVETPDGLILLDTGISRRALDTPDFLTACYGADRHPTGPAGHPLEVALAAVGCTVADISLAAVSHLHLDHTGGISLLAAAGVPIAIQRDELDYGRERAANGTEVGVAFHRYDYLDAGHDVTWVLLDGATELASGVEAIPTPGHTPGHQSFGVHLPATGDWIFAVDAADLGENLLEHKPCGSCAEDSDIPQAQESVDHLIALADTRDARLIPGHDPIVWKAIWHPPGGHS